MFFQISMKSLTGMLLGAISGLAWWIFSAGLEAGSPGGVGAILGRHDLIGATSGLLTGVLIFRISLPIYSRLL